MSIDTAKAALRRSVRARRAAAHRAPGADAGNRLMTLLLAGIEIRPDDVVSGYHPMPGEIDPLPVMARLAADGIVTALPVVAARGRPLIFRQWRDGDPLIAGDYDIPIPPRTAREVVPDLMLVPLLAFDARGYRLGHGAGYYDRTIAVLRRAKRGLRTVGLAFEDQKVDDVPHDGHDEPVDWVVTERAVLHCRPGAGTPVR